jgi:hypothetical protein
LCQFESLTQWEIRHRDIRSIWAPLQLLSGEAEAVLSEKIPSVPKRIHRDHFHLLDSAAPIKPINSSTNHREKGEYNGH